MVDERAEEALPMEDGPRSWLRWLDPRLHPLVVAIGCGGIAFGVGLALAGIPGHGKVLSVIGNVEPRWFALCLVAEAIAYAGYVLALRATATVNEGPAFGFRFSTRVVAAGFGAFLSASAAGGFEIDYWSLRQAGASRREAMRRVLGLGTLEYAILAPAALASALALLFGAGKQPYWSVTLPWLLVVPGFAFAVWATSPVRVDSLVEAEGQRMPRRLLGHAVNGLTVLRQLVLAPKEGALAFAGAALYWFGDILCLWASLKAFHAGVAIPALILAYATGYVFTRRALPLGGVGVAEALLTVALVTLGVPFAPALVGVFAYRIFNFWLAILPALVAAPTVERIRAQIPFAASEVEKERRR
jgi:uncharacterized membrane protein YbhN (UPF0104 family)